MLADIYKKYFFLIISFFLLPVFINAQIFVNINTAGSTELETLNGIGPSKAQAVIDYRTQNGLFGNIEDIKNVSGIGDVTFLNIKDFITIGELNSTTTATTEDGNQASTQTTETSSSHYSATSVSSLKVTPGLEVSAGRDRLGTVGSPLEFKAETNIEYTKNSIFVWSFGDGSEGAGDVVTHTYMYPGDYALVLNVTGIKSKAVSRVNVKITDPKLSISQASADRIEISNNSKSEANLFGRALLVGDKVFNFPKDTIIKAGQKISFISNVTGLHPLSASEVFIIVLGESNESANIAATIEKQKLEQIVSINTELVGLQNQLAKLTAEIKPINSVSVASTPVISASPVVIEQPIEVRKTQKALVVDAVTGVKSSGIKGWFERIKMFFLGEFKIK